MSNTVVAPTVKKKWKPNWFAYLNGIGLPSSVW